MPTFTRTLDARQGYAFNERVQTPVGFITRLALGGTEFAADQPCIDPGRPGATLRAVAVLSHVHWETGVTDAVYFSGHVSAKNKQRVTELIFQGVTDISATFEFGVYAVDPAGQPAAYARVFHSDDAALQGLIEKSGDDLTLAIADDPSDAVPSPRNFVFQLGVKPIPAAQVLHLSTGAGRSLAKPWGVDPV